MADEHCDYGGQLYHLEQDLHITDQQYLIALTIFFFSYAIFEVPSNVFLKRLRPSVWLSLLMFFWGIMMVRRVNCVRVPPEHPPLSSPDRAGIGTLLWRTAW